MLSSLILSSLKISTSYKHYQQSRIARYDAASPAVALSPPQIPCLSASYPCLKVEQAQTATWIHLTVPYISGEKSRLSVLWMTPRLEIVETMPHNGHIWLSPRLQRMLSPDSVALCARDKAGRINIWISPH